MSETGTEPTYSEPVTAPTPPETGTETAAVTAETAPVVQRSAQQQPKRVVTQKQLDALAAARVARSAKAAARKAEHARMSERISVEHSSSDEDDAEYIIRRVRRKPTKPQNDDDNENEKTPVAPTKKTPERNKTPATPTSARFVVRRRGPPPRIDRTRNLFCLTG